MQLERIGPRGSRVYRAPRPLECYLDGVDGLTVPAGDGLHAGCVIALLGSRHASAQFRVNTINDDGTIAIGPAIMS